MAEDDVWTAAMRRGDFTAAWRESDRGLGPLPADEWRRPRHEQRVWTGTSVRGRRVLVRCYHGLGDTIQFARFLPRLRPDAAEVSVWVQPGLLPILQPTPGVDRWLPLHDGVPEVAYDVDLEIMELGHLFRPTLDTLPAAPYVPSPASSAAVDPHLLAAAWRGGDWDRARSLPLDAATTAWQGIDCHVRPLVAALHEPERAQIVAPPSPFPLQDAADLIRRAAIVCTVDTVFAHLAGALGRPVLILLPHHADWRWLDGRDDSPWYPTATLARQERPGDWSGVLSRVRRLLARHFGDRPHMRHTGDARSRGIAGMRAARSDTTHAGILPWRDEEHVMTRRPSTQTTRAATPRLSEPDGSGQSDARGDRGDGRTGVDPRRQGISNRRGDTGDSRDTDKTRGRRR